MLEPHHERSRPATEMPTKPLRSEAGFSLVDMMVALIIFSIGILSVGQLSITARRHSSYGREETMAVSLAQEIKEKIFSENFDDVKSIFDDVDTSDPETINDSCDDWANHVADMFGTNGYGTIDVVDSSEDASLPDDFYQVRVDIVWTSGPNTHQVPMIWMMSKVGI